MGDNTIVIEFAKDSKFHKKTKHIKRRYHFVEMPAKEKKLSLITYLQVNDCITLSLNLFLKTF